MKEGVILRIAIGQVSHETNTFSKVQTTVDRFKDLDWDEGRWLIDKNRYVENYLGGMIERAEQLDIEIVPIFSAGAHPSGIIPKETYETIKQKFRENLDLAEKIDAVCLSLHGAAVAEGIDDLEGDFLSFIHELVGSEIPIIATLDLHGNLTKKMVEMADILIGVNLYPHTDSHEKGVEAITLASKLVKKEINPKMHLEQMPMIIPTSTSNLSPVKEINELCLELEKKSNVIDCAFFHGFPYTDVPFGGISVLCITDGDYELAIEAAKEVTSAIWAVRDKFYPDALSPKLGLEKARYVTNFPVVLNETSDNPGAGTPCDGTRLLSAMLEAKLERACIGIIYDPEVVGIAHEKGVGATIEVYLGGKTDELHGKPILVSAYIKTLTDGVYTQTSPMWRGKVNNLGKTVRLQVGGLDIIVGCIRTQVFDEQPFEMHGINIKQYEIVGLKSSQHFRASYESIAAEIITVDSPGLSTLNLKAFAYEKLKRPIFPLDELEDLKFVE